MLRKLSLLFAITITSFFTACKEYDKPEYEEIKSHETAYVVPLEDVAAKGVKFDSAEYLETKKVAAKRIQIPHRWNQTGRAWYDGEWIDSVRVIKVDRAPVTRQWEPDQKSKLAIWVESSDSIGFSTGFSVTALIDEQDTSTFLYSYSARSLPDVVDTEIRARVQSIAAELAASYKMDVLRDRKNELIEKIRADIIPFFKAKGITITTIGQFGGFAYENPEIQQAIDKTFIAQQVKVTNAAMLEAQTDANKRIELEATAMAEAARSKAKGEADGKLSVFKAEAEGLKAVNQALAEANQNPALVRLKEIDVQRAMTEKWDGKMPVWVTGGNTGSPSMLLQMSPPASK